MRPIFVPPTQTEVRRDPILGRDPWFGNLGGTNFPIFGRQKKDKKKTTTEQQQEMFKLNYQKNFGKPYFLN